jgi:hypothetical protein
VIDTPYFAKTDESGSARLDALPAGDYQLHIWHPYLKSELDPRRVKLADGATESVLFQVDLARPPKAPAAR